MSKTSLQQRIKECCYIHWKHGSDPGYKSVPREHCSWCSKIERLVRDEVERRPR